ncbi:MAG: hypothetical protein FWE18_04725 [Alphaproteobacteria bacterium]|nr:hypothetical protein [Alphaproteobacteria bacterium]
MKIYLWSIIFIIFSFNLSAEDWYIPNYKQPSTSSEATNRYTSKRDKAQDAAAYVPNPYKNSLILGFGFASNLTKQEDNGNTPPSSFALKSNYNLAYLRKFSNKLSIGIDIGMYNRASAAMPPFNDSSTKFNNNNSGRNRVYVDSGYCGVLNISNPGLCDEDTGYIANSDMCKNDVFGGLPCYNEIDSNGNPTNNKIPDCTSYNSPNSGVYCNLYSADPNYGGLYVGKPEIKIDSNSYTAMFLASYELLRYKNVDLSIECGLGATYREMKLSGVVSYNDSATALAYKTGAIGSYYLQNNLTLGAGVYYVYLGGNEFKELGKTPSQPLGYDFKVKSDSAITYNLQLRYMF